MMLRHGWWLWYYQRRSTHWTIGASDGFSMSIGQNSSPMMRYALVRAATSVRHCSQPLSVLLWPSAPHRPLTRPLPCSTAFWVLLMIGDGGQSWLRTVEADLRPMNLGLATSKWHAQDRSAWRKLVTTATSTTGSWRRRKNRSPLAIFCVVYLLLLTVVTGNIWRICDIEASFESYYRIVSQTNVHKDDRFVYIKNKQNKAPNLPHVHCCKWCQHYQ